MSRSNFARRPSAIGTFAFSTSCAWNASSPSDCITCSEESSARTPSKSNAILKSCVPDARSALSEAGLPITWPAANPSSSASRTSFSFAERNKDISRASMYRYGDLPCINMARDIARLWLLIDSITRSPVSGSLRESTITSTKDSPACRLLSERSLWTKGNATPGLSVSFRCSSWYSRYPASPRSTKTASDSVRSNSALEATPITSLL